MKRHLFLVLGLMVAAACGDDPPGTISVDWSLETSAGRQLDCADEFGDTVTLQVTGGGVNDTELFDCTDYSATTGDLPDGTYAVTVSISDANGEDIHDAVTFTSVSVQRGRTTVLDSIVWQF